MENFISKGSDRRDDRRDDRGGNMNRGGGGGGQDQRKRSQRGGPPAQDQDGWNTVIPSNRRPHEKIDAQKLKNMSSGMMGKVIYFGQLLFSREKFKTIIRKMLS